MRYYDVKTFSSDKKPYIIIFSDNVKVRDDFYPYFYVEKRDNVENVIEEYKDKIFKIEEVEKRPLEPHISGPIKMLKIVTYNPNDVRLIRDKLEEMGFKTFDSFIPFTSRFLIDSEEEIERENNKILFLDIETKLEGGTKDYYKGSIITISFYIDGKYHVLSVRGRRERKIVSYDYGDYKIENVIVEYVNHELELLSLFIQYVLKYKPTHIVAWNITFDWNWITKRIQILRSLKFNRRYRWLSPALLSVRLFDTTLIKKFLKLSNREDYVYI